MMRRGSSANGMLLFLIYGMFALFSLFLVIIGAKVYRDLTAAAGENAEVRAAFSYVANKVRMNGGRAGAVQVDRREDMAVLSLRESYEGVEYETVIYFYDGSLREYFGPVGRGFMPEAGEGIAKAADFQIEAQGTDGLLLTMIDTDGAPRSMYLSLPAFGEE